MSVFKCGYKPSTANADAAQAANSDKPKGSAATSSTAPTTCLTPAMISAIVALLLAGGGAYCYAANVGTIATASFAGAAVIAGVTGLSLKYCKENSCCKKGDADGAAKTANTRTTEEQPPAKISGDEFLKRMMTENSNVMFIAEKELAQLENGQLPVVLFSIATLGPKTTELVKTRAVEVLKAVKDPKSFVEFDKAPLVAKNGYTLIEAAVEQLTDTSIIKQLATNEELVRMKSVPPTPVVSPADGKSLSLPGTPKTLLADFVVPKVKDATTRAYANEVIDAVVKVAAKEDKDAAVKDLTVAGKRVYAEEIKKLS